MMNLIKKVLPVSHDGATVAVDELLVVAIVRTYGEDGRPTGEHQSQPVKVFRASTPDIWALVDSQQEQIAAQLVPSA